MVNVSSVANEQGAYAGQQGVQMAPCRGGHKAVKEGERRD